jgi:superfamily II DNA or RNA helicase
VVVDEAHHVPAKTYRRILREYPDAIIIGLTATPCRGDGRGLGSDFDRLIETPQVSELIRLGFLVPTRVFAPHVPNLEGVRVERGDYVEAQLAQRMDRQELTGDVVSHWDRLSEHRRTVVFATGVAHAKHLQEEFCRAGFRAEHINGSTPHDERGEILAKLATGSIEIVTNCGVLTEGWDCPPVSCLVLARPTKSMALFRQMVGRVLRPYPGKTNAIILDHAGCTLTFGCIEEPISWTLHPDRRAENPIQVARGLGHAPQLAVCPECKAVRRQGQPCSNCGWLPQVKPRAVEMAEGELVEVGHGYQAPPPDAPEQFYRQLLWIVRQRGYKPGWAAYKFKARYGDWPPRGWAGLEPLVPSAATLRWVKSEIIRFAKSRGAA